VINFIVALLTIVIKSPIGIIPLIMLLLTTDDIYARIGMIGLYSLIWLFLGYLEKHNY